MPDPFVLTLAADPNLVPGIYNGCDQWCHYCPATARCLAFRGRPEAIGGAASGGVEEQMLESMRYLKACHEAEGLQPPEDLVRLLNGDQPSGAGCPPIDDPLEHAGKHYAVMATAFLATSVDQVPSSPLPKRAGGPTPFEVFLFYHVLIAIKIYRAVSSAGEAARTARAQARWDADVSAKVALVAIDRSDEALHVMTLDDDDPRIAYMRHHLARLRKDVQRRFPAARGLVRPGLDDAAAR
jgi:hypothetical protein